LNPELQYCGCDLPRLNQRNSLNQKGAGVSANKPQPQEITQKPDVDEKEEKGSQKDSKNPIQSGEVKHDTPKQGEPSGERTNP
jgi:hypothetical protein